jgi:hypothetical protein
MRQADRNTPRAGVDNAAGHIGLAEVDPTLGTLLKGVIGRLLDLRQQEFESRIVAQDVVVRIAIYPVPLAPAAVENALE